MSSVAPLWGKPWRLGTASLACGLRHIDVDINIANIRLKELKGKKKLYNFKFRTHDLGQDMVKQTFSSNQKRETADSTG